MGTVVRVTNLENQHSRAELMIAPQRKIKGSVIDVVGAARNGV